MTTRYDHRQSIDILLVEDNPGEARLALEALKESTVSNSLYIVEDGQEALAFLYKKGKYAQAPTPDLILMDLNLPRKNGLEVLSIIKHDSRLKRIPVIMLTISSSEEDIRKAYDLNANCYITKPLNLDQFSRVVRIIEDFWLTVAKLPPKGN